MHRQPTSLELRLALTLSASTLTGCGAADGQVYRPPRLDQAHAVVEVRTRYAPIPWQKLAERIELDGALVAGSAPIAGGTTRSVTVRPGTAAWTVDSSLYLTYTVKKLQPMTSAFSCGPNGATCMSTVVVPVEVQENVPVAVCRTSLSQTVAAGERYVLQFDFLGHARCQLSCYRQRPGAAGDSMEPCPSSSGPGISNGHSAR